MKILIIRNYPSYMAVKNNTYNIQEVGLAKALVRQGHVCDIVFWTEFQEETVTIPVDDMGVIHVFYKHGKTMLKNTIFTACKTLFEQYDILQPCEYNQMQAWILAKQYPKKTVIYHGPYYSPFNKRYNLMCRIFDVFFLQRYIKLGTRFLVKSELAKEFLVNKGIKAENIKVVGVGIDAQMLSAPNENCKKSLFRVMKNDDASIKLLYIGRFEERRNIPLIVDIFKMILVKRPNTSLYMIGTGDTEYLKRIRNYMEKGVRDKIIWQDRMEQKYLSAIYEQADFFLLPTEYDIFGMVLLEAMYYKNVVLTTQNGGSNTMIQNGKNGFIFDNKDAERWANLILNLKENEKKEIQERANKTVAEKFTWDRLATGFIEQYKMTML